MTDMGERRRGFLRDEDLAARVFKRHQRRQYGTEARESAAAELEIALLQVLKGVNALLLRYLQWRDRRRAEASIVDRE